MAKRFVSYLNNFEVEMKEKGKATFKSYINDVCEDETETPFEEDKEEVEKTASEFFDNILQPSLLPGERIITHAENVLKYAPYSDRKQGMSGNLFLTNFKLTFVTADKSSYAYKENKERQRNKLIDDKDIPLTNIDCIYQVISGGRKRVLIPGGMVTSSTKYLEVHCKDFQIHVFGFRFVPKDQNKRVTQAILHHSSPAHDELLFAHEFCLHGKFKDIVRRNLFYERQDWERELIRLQCQDHWCVTDVNQDFRKSVRLPEYFVVPVKITNSEIQGAMGQYIDDKLPIWSYSHQNGASLLRLSHLQPESDFKGVEEKLLSAVKLASGDSNRMEILDLAQSCPSIADVRNSCQQLKALCMTDLVKDFYGQDSTWLSSLENSQWLHCVSRCLKAASDVVDMMVTKKWSVALREKTSSDLTCVVSCLVQLILDPHYRTQNGYAALIQREWVVMGHPFQRRNGLVQGKKIQEQSQPPYQKFPEGEQAPVFLLYLDCTWQLLQQFPSQFGFSETFLTTLWDTLHLGLFDTFLFDSAWERRRFYHNIQQISTSTVLPNAWEWRLQFCEEDTYLFSNPLYVFNSMYELGKTVVSFKRSLRGQGKKSPASPYSLKLSEIYDVVDQRKQLFHKPQMTMLTSVSWTIGILKLWSQCYLRWCVPAQILGGGYPAQYLQQCLLVEEVICLHHRLRMLEEQQEKRSQAINRFPRPHSGLVFSLESQSVLDSGVLTSSFPFPTAVTQQTQHNLISGPLSIYLHESLVRFDDDDYADAEDD